MQHFSANDGAKAQRARRMALIERLYAAVGRSDVEGVVACYTPDCRIRLIGDPAMNPYCGLRVGHEGVRFLLGGIFSSYGVVEVIIDAIVMDGDEAAVFWTVKGEHRSSGVLLDTERCDRLGFEGDLVAETVHFFDTAFIGLITGRLGLLVTPDRSAL